VRQAIEHFIANHLVLIIIVVALLVMFGLPRGSNSFLKGLFALLTIIALLALAGAVASAIGGYLSPSYLFDKIMGTLPSWLRAFFEGAQQTAETVKTKYHDCLEAAVRSLNLEAFEKQFCTGKQGDEWDRCILNSVLSRDPTGQGLVLWNNCRQNELVNNVPPVLAETVFQKIMCPWVPKTWFGCGAFQ